MSNAYDPAQPPPDQNQPPAPQNAPPPQLPMNQPAPNDLGLPDLSRQPQQQQDNSQNGLPPGWGSDFFGNFGPQQQPNRSPPDRQGRPPPTWPPKFTENRRQLYVPSMANREPHKLGQPPTFPHKPDMWQVPNIYEGVGRQMARWGGSRRTRFLAGNLASFTNAYMRAMQSGQRDYAAQQHSRMTQVADALLTELGNELTGYGKAYASYSNDPEALHGQLMDTASQLGDVQMQAALNTSPEMAERLQQWRQAKFDDLHRSNSVRREHDEALKARNPFMINPIGADGMPAARQPLPFKTKPERLTQVAAASISPQGFGQGRQAPIDDPDSPDAAYDIPTGPRDDRGGDPGDADTFERGGQQDPATPQKLPTDQKPLPEPGTDADVDSGPEQQARRDGRVRLAQADTGTMSDAPPPGAQQEGDQDGRTIWDDVRLRSERREAAGQRGESGGAGAQPPGAAGTGQPSPQGAAGQAQPPAGPGGTGQPAPGGAQAPNQAVPPQAGAQGAQDQAAAGGQQPLTMTPALQAAQQAGLQPQVINDMGQRYYLGQMTATELRALDKTTRDAVVRRSAEMQGQLTNIITRGVTGDAVIDEVAKINPVMAEDMRAIKAGVAAPPKKGPTEVMRALMFKADPTFTDATYQNRAKAMANYTSGAASKNLTSAGTALRHADRLISNLKTAPGWLSELAYSKLPLAVLARMPGMGDTVTKMQQMEVDAQTLGSEYASALAAGGGGGGRGSTGFERREAAEHINIYAPSAAIARVEEMKVEVAARVEQLRKQFEADTGMSFDKIRGKFDIPGMDAGGQGGNNNVIDFRDVK